jgi:GNAT superfamily N-acetyltransferase
VFHEVCPLADPAHMALLVRHGYHPIELSNVMFQPLPIGKAPTATDIVVRRAAPEDNAVFAQTFAEGWADAGGPPAPLILALAEITAARSDGQVFLAEQQGRPIGAGALVIHERVALLAGASTIPAARGRGAQLAMLAHRLEFAARCGCDLAMVVALPGSGSQRNAERNGFRIAYTRTKWHLAEGRA